MNAAAADNAGSARQITPGRLASFEDDDADLGAGTMSLPPRRPRKQRPTPPEAVSEPGDASVAEVVVSDSVVAEISASAPSSRPAKGPEDKVRPSNVHIPVTLLEPLTEKCRRDGLSHGEVIIVAIEQAYPRLNELIHPPATAGGTIFASRRSRASRTADGPLTPLNYRLRVGDYETLDRLVDEFKASSRGQLITAALNDYFGQT